MDTDKHGFGQKIYLCPSVGEIVFKTASTTRSTLMPFIQRKSMGHSRRKHGEHGASDLIKRFRASPGKPGPVNSGDVLPKITTTGTPSADATCIGPVSFVKSTRQDFKSDINSRKEVLPARLEIADCGLRIADSIRLIIVASFFPPN